VKRLCATVLLMETIVIGLAIPVAVEIDHVPLHRAGVVGGAVVLSAVLLAVLARWLPRLTLVGGSLLQLLVIIGGVVVPVLYFLGAIFTALWIIGIWLGHRVERAS
jgi:Protein of unknown function (DUF4233)